MPEERKMRKSKCGGWGREELSAEQHDAGTALEAGGNTGP